MLEVKHCSKRIVLKSPYQKITIHLKVKVHFTLSSCPKNQKCTFIYKLVAVQNTVSGMTFRENVHAVVKCKHKTIVIFQKLRLYSVHTEKQMLTLMAAHEDLRSLSIKTIKQSVFSLDGLQN